MIEDRDTSADAARSQRAAFRRLSPSDRVVLALQMSEESRALAKDGIRHRRPNLGEAEIESALRWLMLGDKLADRVNSSR